MSQSRCGNLWGGIGFRKNATLRSSLHDLWISKHSCWGKKKTGLVGPVSHGVELDAVTSQHGATGAEAAGLVAFEPVFSVIRLPGSAS